MVSQPFEWIDRQSDLDALVKHLQPFRDLPLDTEADNMYHYRNRICLFQVRTGDAIFLVDGLAGLELGGFVEALRPKRLIMHGSDFDLRLMADHYGFRPAEIFDTMLGAQLLGLNKFGLGALTEHFLDIELAKGHQKSDWSRRPLPEKMLRYAAEDVLYLTEIQQKIAAELEQKGRMAWLRQRCEWQIEAAIDGFADKDEHAWRLSGSVKLKPRGLAVLYELWHWREHSAEKADLPPFKIVNNHFLLDLATAAQEDSGSDWREALPPRVFARHRKALERVVQRGMERDPKALPKRANERRSRQPFTAEELERQETLRAARDRHAEALGIDPALIANRSQLAVLCRDRERLHDLLLPWQADLIGDALAET